MLLADTNLLVRHFTQDDPGQCPKATRLIEKTVKDGETLGVTDVVFAELFWVLLSGMDMPKDEVLKVAISILGDPVYELENHELVAMAVGLWMEKNVNFTDAYLAAKYETGLGDAIVSFDQDFKRLPVRWIQP